MAIAALHQGAPLADNAQQAVNFFVDAQRRIDGGLVALTIESFVLYAIGYFAPDPWRSRITTIALFLLTAIPGQVLELGELLNIPKVPALPDLSPNSAAVQGLARFDDSSIPRANVYGTIPFKHAAIRVGLSLQGKDRDFASTVDTFNKGLTAFTVCKYVGYATIVLGRQGRACAYARKVMKRIDERWVRYVNGTDGYGRPRYVPFDGIVPNERSQYPTPNGLAYDIGVNGVNHQNIYTRQAGLDQVAEGMRRMGMVQGGGTPGPSPSAVVDGPTQIQPGATCTWYAAVSGGTAPYSYQWTNAAVPVGNDYWYTGSKAVGSGGSSFALRVVVTDAVGAIGEHEITVYENSSAGLCQT